MTPRIAFAVAFALACVAASADDVANQGLPFPNVGLAKTESINSAQQLASDGALPVVELVAPVRLAETIDLTSEPEELFQRMRQGFSMPNINNALVLHHQQWYLNHPESLRRMVERSSRYLHHIVEEIEKRGMPMELALLPMVESAYNPTAYSRSHASGLWQFVPATGKQYKLEQNWWVDERRDIVASTAAALEYLQYIYDLHGDWHLALASYNWGEGAVGRAINKNKANGLPTDYLSLTMPEETRHYVPKLQALKNVFSNPNILATLNIRGVPNRPYFATVTKTANIDVTLAARLAEMPVKEFVALNPAHNRPVIKSETPMVIPAHKVDTFISNLEAHEESEKPLSSWQAYTLRPGEKLEEVAPRFGMTVANLKAVNGISGRIRMSPGLTLLVAGQEGADPADVAGLPEPRLVAEQPRLPQVVEPAPVATAHTHTVQKGETLLKVAQRYGMTLTELKQINKLRAERATAGTRLTVATPEPAVKPAPAGQRTTLARSEDGKQASPRSDATAIAVTRSHAVRKGETLSEIASRYDMTLAELKQINKLRVNQVNAGTRLAVAAPEPVSKPLAGKSRSEMAEVESRQDKAARSGRQDVARVDVKTAEKAANKARDASEQTRPGSKKQTKLAQYTIRRGDTLVSIAKQFRVEKDDILRWNRIQSNDLKPGQRLTIQLVQNSF
jgi:membrane-bound lytic murein transglycosylase D